MTTTTVISVLGGIVILAAISIVALTRRTHLRSWKFGVFFESEEKIGRDLNHKKNKGEEGND
jgi:hypothetical protein